MRLCPRHDGEPCPASPKETSSLPTTVWKPNRLPVSIVDFVVMRRPRWLKRRVVSSGYVAIRPICHFVAVGDVKWSMSVLAYAIPTMRTTMLGLGRVARNAVISGHHETTKPMQRTPSIGQDIEGPGRGHEARIMSTENVL